MIGGDTGGRKLSAMLRELRPALQDGQWVFITAEAVPTGVTPLATFAEEEGLSLLLRREQADSLGLAYDFVGAWISLTVHSALDAVVLTAAVAGQLARSGISCNVIAARSHDHLLVPHEQARRVVALIEQLAEPAGAP